MPNSDDWQEAMQYEIDVLAKNRTWDLVDLPRGRHPVKCKWVYRLKFDANGQVNQYQARLVAKGFTQTYGLNFDETFAPVMCLDSI